MIRGCFFLGLVLTSVLAAPPHHKIVNGSPAKIEDFPYQVAILYKDKMHCGGSIISSNHILTAAHCVYGFLEWHMKVRVGSTHNNEGGQLIELESSIYHPDYSSITYDYDIAVLTLAEDIHFGEAAQPVALMKENDLEDGAMAVISGWGSEEFQGPAVEDLQQLDVPYIVNDVCKTYYSPSQITLNMVCAGYVNGEGDSCQGDSGGPLVVNGEQLGVVSWGKGCAEKGYPGVYTSVPVLHDWVKQQTGI